jgi:hypothetical protein
MAMGARFDGTLEFQSNGSLEVCGPVQFGSQGVLFEVLGFEITDGKNNKVSHKCNPPVRAGIGEMWETDLDPAAAQNLQPGPGATAKGRGRMYKRTGGSVPRKWTQDGIVLRA